MASIPEKDRASFDDVIDVALANRGIFSRSVVTPSMSIEAIIAAINAANAKSIFFEPGTYELGNATLPGRSNCLLWAVPGSVTLTKTTTAGAGFKSAFFDCTDVVNFTIQGLSFIKAAACPREYAVILRATLQGLTKNVKILGCSMLRCGVYVERYVEDWIVDSCSLDGDGSIAGGSLQGIAVGGQIINGVGTNTNGPIKGGKVSNNFITRQQTEAVDINWDTWDTEIVSNFCLNNNITGGGDNETIDVGGGDCRDIIVRNNRIIQDSTTVIPATGVRVKLGTKRAKVLHNTIRLDNIPVAPVATERWSGIHINGSANTIVAYNDIQGFHRAIAASGSVASLHVLNNKTRKSVLSELLITGSVSNQILDVVVDGNEFGDSTTNTLETMDFDYVFRAVIAHNFGRGVGNRAVVRVRSTCSDIEVVDNHRLSNARYGVEIDAGTTGVRVCGNKFRDLQRNAVWMNGASTEYWIKDNDSINTNLDASGAYAYVIEGAGGTISDNTARDSAAADGSRTTANGFIITATSDGCSWRGNKARNLKSGGTPFSGLANLTNLVS